MPRFCSFSPLKWHWMHPILKASRKILTSKYYDKFAFIQIRDSMGAHLIFFIIFTLFSCIILTNQSLPWYSLRSGFQCDTNMAAVFSVMRPKGGWSLCEGDGTGPLHPTSPIPKTHYWLRLLQLYQHNIFPCRLIY